MVADRITDGTRIAELLASEVTGHERAPYDRTTVTLIPGVRAGRA